MQGMMACGHIYNPVTKTGLELSVIKKSDAGTSKPPTGNGKKNTPATAGGSDNTTLLVRLWQNGELLATATRAETSIITATITSSVTATATLLSEGEGEEGWKWDYWYNLRFVQDFPQVTHWWFGSSWTGKVRLSQPTGTIETTTVVGLMQFVDEEVPAMPWMLTDGSPVLVHTPLPPFEVNAANLPLRIALSQLVIELIQGEIEADQWQLVTSLVERDQLADFFPTTFQPWQIETAQPLPLREVLCLMQGLREPGSA